MTHEFVTLPREVVEQALRALEYGGLLNRKQALAALRAALEQPQVEQPAMTPIAQRKLSGLLGDGWAISGYSICKLLPSSEMRHGFVTAGGMVEWLQPEGVEYPQPQGWQEPVAFAIFTEDGSARMWSTFQPHVQKLADAEGLTVTPLYTHQQTKRTPLTDEQLNCLWRKTLGEPHAPRKSAFYFARAIEAAHKIK